ncbi:MAG: helix-turn-helix domain-containing protein [Streptosporangiaceae bacterium]
MVHGDFREAHGARDESTRRTVTPDLAAVLAAARRRRGWSLREAARNVGVAHGTIAHLEKARRAPSAIVAESIFRAYRLDPDEAAMLRAEAVEGAGWDSPFKQGTRRTGRLSMEAGSAGVFYGAQRGGRSRARLQLAARCTRHVRDPCGTAQTS